MPVQETVDRAARDVRDLASDTPAGVRLVVRQPVPPPAPRWPPRAASRAGRAAPRAPSATAVELARAVAIGVLVLLFVAATAFVVSGSDGRPLPRADMHSFEQRLIGHDHDVRAQLARLGPPGSVSRARVRTREALAATAALADQLRDFEGPAAARLRTAARVQLRYLDALGSTLLNPRSPLRAQLPARGLAARKALAAFDRPGRR